MTLSSPVILPFGRELPLARAACSTRAHGNLSVRYGDTTRALRDRRLFLCGLSIDHEKLVCGEQVHADRVHYATSADCARSPARLPAVPGVDAFVTDERGLPVAVFSADCCCVFIYDPARPAIGLAHAGWKGTSLGIAVRTLEAMRARFGTDPALVSAGFSPSVRGCCYEIGDEVAARFPEGVLLRRGRRYLDLVEQNLSQLVAAGVQPRTIHDPGLCTRCAATDFFSYRREGASCGRMMSVCMLIEREGLQVTRHKVTRSHV